MWVYPPGPRPAVENHRDIFVNSLFLAYFFFFSPGCRLALS